MSQTLVSTLKRLLRDPVLFTEKASGVRLRKYQIAPIRAIVESVINNYGDTIVVIFPRQSGKNELQGHTETYLLTLFSQVYPPREIVKVSPTKIPQSANAQRRLERFLKRNLITRDIWEKKEGYIYQVGEAACVFLSGGPGAAIVGATASLLLSVDEAQDIQIAKFDKDILPMAASTNATRVFWGTRWTSTTLLERELRSAFEAQNQDGRRRVFLLNADDVGAEVPYYRKFVANAVAQKGRNHPMVKTQYFSETIDGEGGMFPPARRALLQGSHLRHIYRNPTSIYVMLVDVAGEDESQSEDLTQLINKRRDATQVTIVEIDLSTITDPILARPSYNIVHRRSWVGIKHVNLYGQLKAYFQTWGCLRMIIDATGIGAGITSFMIKALGEINVIPFIFNSATKSKLGWDFISVIESGRLKDYMELDDERARFNLEMTYCQMKVIDGPNKLMRWGVPDNTRDPETGELIHDDAILSLALVALLDDIPLGLAESGIIPAIDPLADLDPVF